MKTLWKEWQQQKWLFLIGCLAGISFPVIESLLTWRRSGEFRTNMGVAIVTVCGALYAIILSITTTHHDTNKGTDNFWRSKPIGIGKLFTIKSLVGAAVLFISFLFVMGLDFYSTYRLNNFIDQDAWTSLCYTYPLALFLFTSSMFLLVVLRDSAKTVLLAIWLALLIYFLPLLIGSLEWLNIFEQLNNANQRPSLLQYIIWICSLPKGASFISDVPVGVPVPAGLPIAAYQKVRFQTMWMIVCSPAYLRYLFFIGAAITGIISSVILTSIAFNRNWRWHPGQKTIAWILGLSAAFIFGVAMVQVGHNLEPVEKWRDKEIVNPATFQWEELPSNLIAEIGQPNLVSRHLTYFDRYQDSVCIKDDLMYRITGSVYSSEKESTAIKWDDEAIKHFIIEIFKFPYADESDNYVGSTKLFSTEPVKRHEIQKVLGCFIRGNYLYTAFRPNLHKDVSSIYFSVIDITNPQQPKEINRIDIKPRPHCFSGAFAGYDDYCYLSDGGQLVIISVAEADSPEIVRQIPYRIGGGSCATEKKQESGYSFVLGDDPGFPSNDFKVFGNKLLCTGYNRIAILDLTKPTKPKVVYDESFSTQQFSEDNRIQAAAYRDNYIYISTNDGLYIRELTQKDEGKFSSVLIGDRKATPIEKFAGRSPKELLFFEGYLVEASGSFGVIVYDVSNPKRPERAYHAASPTFTSDIGIWNNLLFTQNYGFKIHFFDIPQTD